MEDLNRKALRAGTILLSIITANWLFLKIHIDLPLDLRLQKFIGFFHQNVTVVSLTILF